MQYTSPKRWQNSKYLAPKDVYTTYQTGNKMWSYNFQSPTSVSLTYTFFLCLTHARTNTNTHNSHELSLSSTVIDTHSVSLTHKFPFLLLSQSLSSANKILTNSLILAISLSLTHTQPSQTFFLTLTVIHTLSLTTPSLLLSQCLTHAHTALSQTLSYTHNLALSLTHTQLSQTLFLTLTVIHTLSLTTPSLLLSQPLSLSHTHNSHKNSLSLLHSLLYTLFLSQPPSLLLWHSLSYTNTHFLCNNGNITILSVRLWATTTPGVPVWTDSKCTKSVLQFGLLNDALCNSDYTVSSWSLSCNGTGRKRSWHDAGTYNPRTEENPVNFQSI